MAHRPTGYLGDEIKRFNHYGKHQRLHLRSVKLMTDGKFRICDVRSWHTTLKETLVCPQGPLGLGVLPCTSLTVIIHPLWGSLPCLQRLFKRKSRNIWKGDGKW